MTNTFLVPFFFFLQTLGMEQRFDYATPLTAFVQVSVLHKWLQYVILQSVTFILAPTDAN